MVYWPSYNPALTGMFVFIIRIVMWNYCIIYKHDLCDSEKQVFLALFMQHGMVPAIVQSEISFEKQS